MPDDAKLFNEFNFFFQNYFRIMHLYFFKFKAHLIAPIPLLIREELVNAHILLGPVRYEHIILH